MEDILPRLTQYTCELLPGWRKRAQAYLTAFPTGPYKVFPPTLSDETTV
jgi:hypothetical protein